MIEAEIVHHIAGRMRIRVPAAKGDPERLEEIRSSIGKLSGVLEVTANPGLGTLLLYYDPALFGEAIQRVTEHASKADLFLLRPPDEDDDDPTPVSTLDRAVDHFFGRVNRIVEAATGNAVNLKEIFPFGIILYAVLFLDKAIAASQWLNLVQFALGTYLELHEDEPVAEVGDSVKALRAELQELRKELRTHFEKQNN
jgi:Heavy metal associated domain 2